ncbi:MAG TPA: glycosyltransferase family 2 protein [Candidatus Thermoplasmatota archaeon]|nr:glycosyltransferase family 2 protein [Candidatus Thermoplasmatota archaeon]
MKVTILIPTLNEEKGIGPTLDTIDRKAFEALGWELEVLVVDGASKDRTREEAQARGATILVEPRRGYGRAYKEGFKAATGDVIITGDADGTYPFERAHEFAQMLLHQDLDFINCDRYGRLEKGAMSPKHLLGNWVLSTTARILFSVRLRDSQSGMWIIRRSALAKVQYEDLSNGMAFSQEIKIEFLKGPGLRFAEVPSSLRPRIGKPVLSSWRDGWGNLKGLYAMRVERRW